MMNSWHYLVILFISLLNITTGSILGGRYFRNGKLWLKKENNINADEPHWLEQKLDHFDPNENRTWKQRYFVKENLANNKRDVAFLQIGGESGVNGIEYGAWKYYAVKPKAIMFELEHRYYGESRPTENLSVENMKYLSSRQALADIAFFIESMNKKYQLAPNVKWIVFGGSYAGSLAAWARQQYPHLIHGAVSSSGPLLAKVDFFEYLQVVEDALRTSSETCLTVVQEAYKQLEDLLNDAENRHKISKLFSLCEKIEERIDKPLDIYTFFQILSDSFSNVVQYNVPYTSTTTDYICGMLTNVSAKSELDRLAELIVYLLEGHYRCTSIDYEKFIAPMKPENWTDTDIPVRQWFYQTCTEFGFYQTSTVEPYTFSRHLTVDNNLQLCKEAYSPAFDKAYVENAVDKTNDFYHGLDINVTNIVYVHGSLDPWHRLGVTKTQSEDATVIILEGASHCTDMLPPSTRDSEQLQKAHEQINDLIIGWLNN